MKRSILAVALLAMAMPGVTSAVYAQAGSSAPRQFTAADYGRAERALAANTTPLVYGTGVSPVWRAGEVFTYSVLRPTRVREMMLVNPVTASKLSCATNVAECNKFTAQLVNSPALAPSNASWSPDRSKYAFIRDWNLYVTNAATKQETQVTTDGVPNFGYATDNAGWTHSDNAIITWSPDSKKIATFQQDQRNVREMYLVSTNAGHPQLDAWKYPFAGDTVVSMIQRVIIDLSDAQPKVVRLQMPPDQHRSTVCDHISCAGGEFADVQWYPDGRKLAFVSSSRDHKVAQFRVADATTGVVRDILREEVKTQFESGDNVPNWRILPASNELLWFSERDNWGQLYLYDLTTGALKHKVTTGSGNVSLLLHVDEKTRQLFFVGVGKEPDRDPYFRHLYRIGLDGKGLTLLTPEDGDHNVTWSPSKKYFLDSWSRPDLPGTAVLRDGVTGKLMMTLETGDISQLLTTGWKPPARITVKARDGKTDLYGLMFTPSNLDSTKKYPIINYIYPGPQTGSVGSRSFSPARGDHQALAELGFVVVHSGGGFATAGAMFRYPDFFKVGIAESGNHDNRVYEDDWGERYQGLLVRDADGSDNYAAEANQTVAKNLKGKLLLAHGTMDDNVPPDNTMLVVDALIKANKDFDLLLLPNLPHGYGPASNYMMRRRWDYFVTNLLGATPPKDYVIGVRPR